MNNEKILFIMGNGPSLKEVMDNPEHLQMLKDNHSFGLNAAYRAYDKYDFYPTYFGCFDYRVNVSHKDAFEELVLGINDIEEFYFIGDQVNKQMLYKDVIEHPKFIQFSFITGTLNNFTLSKSMYEYFDPGSSGSNALQIGILKGYKKIVLIGCDCNYVERVEGSETDTKSHQLTMTKDLDDNPNYWFSDYQKKGDKFNLPQTGVFQIKSWENMARTCPEDVTILNCSEISKIPYFEKRKFEDI